jgi:tRNA(Ile)-lysidine synthase
MLLSEIRETVKKFNLIDKNDRILIGVSGGPDSVALLHLLNSLRKELNLDLRIAHLDHKLRKGSGRDLEFVRRLGKKLGLPVITAKTDISRRGSIEQNARDARLTFFFKTAKKIGAKKIALGHNRDDQAETVLMRMIRGAGLYGLNAILIKKEMKGFTIIRPLLRTPRKEIEAYLVKRKIKFCLDLSNSQDRYFRNKIRNKLLPLLESGYNKNIREVLSNMAESVGADYDYLNLSAIRVMKGAGKSLNLDKIIKLHPAIQRIILRMNIARLKGDTRRVTFRHMREIEDLILNRPANSIVNLPKGICIIKHKKTLLFYRDK